MEELGKSQGAPFIIQYQVSATIAFVDGKYQALKGGNTHTGVLYTVQYCILYSMYSGTVYNNFVALMSKFDDTVM